MPLYKEGSRKRSDLILKPFQIRTNADKTIYMNGET